jgi:hypothetical protein
MIGLAEVETFIVLEASLVAIHAVKDNVSSIRSGTYDCEDLGKPDTAPLCDCAPTVDAIVPRDLTRLWHRLQTIQRKRMGSFDRSVDDQTVRPEVRGNESGVLRARGCRQAIKRKVRGDRRFRIRLGKTARTDECVVERLGDRQ